MTLTVASTAPTSGLTGLGAVQPHVKAAAELIAAQGGITKVGGWRSYSAYDMGGHPAGLAVDFPGTKAQGDAMAAYTTANADKLAVKYVIWQQRIWYPGKAWAAMADRGSVSANHLDHVHVSFKATGAGGSWLDTLRDGITHLPIIGGALETASNATSVLNPATWGAEAQKVGLKLAVVGAGLGLLLLGSWRIVLPAATTATSKAMEVIA
jgi:hypothetical protein